MTATHTDPAVLLADARTSIADLRVAQDCARRTVLLGVKINRSLREELDMVRSNLNLPKSGADTYQEAQDFAARAAQFGVDVDDTAVSA